jgi:pimeloyl-ACP methyl ester carboxylesterase
VTPETKYTKSGDLYIAYQVVGEGQVDLIFVHGWISHIEILWEEPSVARFFERLASFSRLILLDKRGTGMSDPVPLDQLPTLEQRMDDVRAVMDAAGSDRAILCGTSEAGALNLLFAATYPDRCAGLILINSYARLAWREDYPYGIKPADAEALLNAIAAEWGKGIAFEALVASQASNESMRKWWARYQRLAASRGVLSAITVPTLILHKKGDPFTGPEHGRYLAQRIANAKFVELAGIDHLFFVEDADPLVAEIQEFVTGARAAPEPQRVLATILFTDIVGSTEKAAKLGDTAWHDLLHQHHIIIRRQLATFRGQELKTLGDGFLASFDGPARALRCACAIIDAIRELNLEVRAGVHTGECELVDGELGGIAVHTGARVASIAGPSEVLVSSTVRDLVAGSGLRFEARGAHTLKGVPGEWSLFAVVRS